MNKVLPIPFLLGHSAFGWNKANSSFPSVWRRALLFA